MPTLSAVDPGRLRRNKNIAARASSCTLAVMEYRIPALDFQACLADSPNFRRDLHKCEKDLEQLDGKLKGLFKITDKLITKTAKSGTTASAFAEEV